MVQTIPLVAIAILLRDEIEGILDPSTAARNSKFKLARSLAD